MEAVRKTVETKADVAILAILGPFVAATNGYRGDGRDPTTDPKN